jgi:hypothetical protein
MWVSPNHPNPPRRPDAPRENGERLATFARHGGEELRVSLAEFNGHPFISLRVWAPGPDGQLLPVRGKGVSVKLREVAGLAEALAAVAGQLDQVGGEGQAPGPQEPRPERPRTAPLRHDAGGHASKPMAPQRRTPAADFDEFAGEDA